MDDFSIHIARKCLPFNLFFFTMRHLDLLNKLMFYRTRIDSTHVCLLVSCFSVTDEKIACVLEVV